MKGIWFITRHPHPTPWNLETKVASTGCERSVAIANTKRSSLSVRKNINGCSCLHEDSPCLAIQFHFVSSRSSCQRRMSVGSRQWRVSHQEHKNCVSSAEDWLVQFSSRWYLCAQKGPYALHPVSQKFPNVAFETVPMFVWLTMALSRPFKVDRLALPLCTTLSSGRSVMWRPWLCARR